MKTKNVILGLCALFLALGSAFASLQSSPTEDSIPVNSSPYTCEVIDEQSCDNNSTSQVCTIEVKVAGMSLGQRQVYDNIDCTSAKFHSTGDLPGSIDLP